MNKIFKVVWSKVRNAYVVVSEIAKNIVSGVGKRNRVKRFSLGATLAACALTSSFFLPNWAYAAELGANVQTDYLAIAISNNQSDSSYSGNPDTTPTSPFEGKTVYGDVSSGYYVYVGDIKYNFAVVKVGENQYKYYWVRDGFGVAYSNRMLHPNAATSARVDLYMVSGANANYSSAAVSGEHTSERTDVKTAINGVHLNNLSYHTYGAITNSPTTEVSSQNQFFIRRERLDNTDDNGYDDVGSVNLKDNFYVFKSSEYNSATGKYQFNGKDVEYDDVYVIKNQSYWIPNIKI